LRPAVRRHRELPAVLPGQLERARRERAAAQLVHDGLGGVRVDQVVGGHLRDRGERQGADHVGQGAGRGGRGDEAAELVLVGGHDPDLGAGRGGESVGDRLGGLDPVGLVLQAPHGERAVVVALAVVAAGGQCGEGEQDDRGAEGPVATEDVPIDLHRDVLSITYR
jgi:hypothetical protein